jgi:hypothetical protein
MQEAFAERGRSSDGGVKSRRPVAQQGMCQVDRLGSSLAPLRRVISAEPKNRCAGRSSRKRLVEHDCWVSLAAVVRIVASVPDNEENELVEKSEGRVASIQVFLEVTPISHTAMS